MTLSTDLPTAQHAAQAAGALIKAPLIEARGLVVKFSGRAVLDHVDIAIRPAEIVTVVGLNGSGKSTLARALLGLVPAQGGTISRAPGLKVSYVPQNFQRDAILPLTVARFVGLAGRFSPAEIVTQLEALGIGALAGAQLVTLSGGELRRALIARALIRAPHLLVLDEPMSGVDVAGQVDLYRVVGRIRRERGCGILLISHDLHLVMAETDHVICLNHHVCCAGGPQSVVRDPGFAALFGQDVAESLAIYRHHHDHVHDPAGHVHPPHAQGPDGAEPGTPHE